MQRIWPLALLILSTGCGGDDVRQHILRTGGATITIRQPGQQHTWVSETSATGMAEKDTTTGLVVAVDNQQLWVNGLYWCNLAAGDQVLIENNELTLNGNKVVPPP